MDRKKIMQAVLDKIGLDTPETGAVVGKAMKQMSDTSLVMFAQDMGIDTDNVLRPEGHTEPEETCHLCNPGGQP